MSRDPSDPVFSVIMYLSTPANPPLYLDEVRNKVSIKVSKSVDGKDSGPGKTAGREKVGRDPVQDSTTRETITMKDSH